MKVKIYHYGKIDDSITIESETLKEIGATVKKEIEKRNWKPEDC